MPSGSSSTCCLPTTVFSSRRMYWARAVTPRWKGSELFAVPAFALAHVAVFRGLTAGVTPTLPSRRCCSGFRRVQPWACRASQRPMSSPRCVTPGTIPSRPAPPLRSTRRPAQWRCQSMVHPSCPGFQSGSIAASCSARRAAHSGSSPSPPGRRRLVSHCPTGLSRAVAWRPARSRRGPRRGSRRTPCRRCPRSCRALPARWPGCWTWSRPGRTAAGRTATGPVGRRLPGVAPGA